MKRWLVAAIIAGALLPKLAFAAGSVVELPAGVGDEVNVTSDSAAGWVPTVDQRVAAVQTAQHFIDAVEQGHFAEAYGLFAAPVKAHRTMAEFEQAESKFQALAGPARFWRVHRLTWTKDPSRAPAPGVYVAIDL